jgi:hypothetical protein
MQSVVLFLNPPLQRALANKRQRPNEGRKQKRIVQLAPGIFGSESPRPSRPALFPLLGSAPIFSSL